MQDDVGKKITDFFSRYPTRHYNKRHILIYTGDPVPYVFFIKQGAVKQYAISYKGGEVILTLFRENEFFPMAHVINNSKTKYLFEAETDLEIQLAPAADVLKFLNANADCMLELLQRVYRGTENLLGRIEQLMTGTAKTRLVYELIVEARRSGTKNTDGNCTIELSEKDFASRSGLSRETVNREIHKLKEADLILIRRNNIQIPNLNALVALLDT